MRTDSFQIPFDFGTVVVADGNDVRMRFTAVTVRADDTPLLECSYWLNGEQKTVWLPLWRLQVVQEN